MPDAAEELEDGDPAGLQADQGGGGSHRGQLQGGDEAGEVQGQGARRPASDQRNSLPVTRPNWRGSRTSVGPAITTAPMALRQKAMARALTVVAPRVAAISGPDEATPRTPRAARKKFTVQH